MHTRERLQRVTQDNGTIFQCITCTSKLDENAILGDNRLEGSPCNEESMDLNPEARTLSYMSKMKRTIYQEYYLKTKGYLQKSLRIDTVSFG